MKIAVLVIGSYPYPMLDNLKRALSESIRTHMSAYGVRPEDVRIGESEALLANLQKGGE